MISSIYKHGTNLMTLLAFSARIYGEKAALVDEQEIISYKQLLLQSQELAVALRENYQVRCGQKVGILCKNHGALVKSIFAISVLGADIYLLNAEISEKQFNHIAERFNFDLVIYDFELETLLNESSYTKSKIISYHDDLMAVNNLRSTNLNHNSNKLRSSSSKIIILTGGTTGNSKTAPHNPSLFNYLDPYLTLLTSLNLVKYHTAYIATPIYHGYGLAMLLLFLSLGNKVVISRGFNAEKACALIREHKVQVVTLVPLMLSKMIENDADDLKSLACIVSGGARLNPKLVKETFNKLGNVLCNLYGTSEAGLVTVATPQDLQYSAQTIGRKISGVKVKILDTYNKKVEIGRVGQFYIKSGCTISNNNSWVATGDLGYQDSKGYYFLCGRTDDMIVSAGENVYPIEVEQELINHPHVQDVMVVGINDDIFGQRLKAYVQLKDNKSLTADELLEWLGSRVARFQLPKEIVFVDSIPYTPLGKHDKKHI